MERYGLKEKALGKLLIKALNISNDSPDAKALLQWKQGALTSAGNFSERCFDIFSKRDTKPGFGDMTVAEVNDLLDQLSSDQDSKAQLVVIKKFLNSMNSEEMRWIVRIVLRCE
jgi:DNA ligase-4